MFQLGYQDIVDKIKKEKGLSDGEIEQRIKDKLGKLSDLISKEGAAHIIAHELHINIYDALKQGLKINKLAGGMNSITVKGRVVTMYPVREFQKNNRSGKVGNILIGDETGTIRVVFWDLNHIKDIEEDKLKEGSVLRLKNVYIRGNNGFPEIHAGNRSEIEYINEDIEVGNIQNQELALKKISELQAGDFVKIFGTVVQVFEPKFYLACDVCNKKVEDKCVDHGEADVVEKPIVNIHLDDGSGNLRVVAFRGQAEKIVPGIESLRGNPENFIKMRDGLLGNQYEINGRVVKNDMFERLEFVANDVQEIDPERIVDMYVQKLGG